MLSIKARAEEIVSTIRNSPARWEQDVPKVESILTAFYNDIKRWTPDEYKRSIASELLWIERTKKIREEALEVAAKTAESLKDKYKDCAVGYHLGSAHMAVNDIPKAIRALKDSK